MCWRKRDRWKAGIAIASLLLLLVLMTWTPVSMAGAHKRASGLTAPGMVTVQATPTEDATVTALNKEKLAQEIDQLKNQNHWAWTTIGPIFVGFAGLLAALYSFITWIRNRQDEQKKQREDRNLEREKRDEEQKRWLEDRQAEREKRAEERFQAVCVGLGGEREEAKAGAAIVLRTFLRSGYEQFYTQTFDLAVAHLRLPRTPHPPADPDTALPLTTLSQALIVVFKEAFPLARERLKEQDSPYHPQALDALGIQLDNAYLRGVDLKQAWMPWAFLRKVDLREADLRGVDLRGAKLCKATLRGSLLHLADLSRTDLREADLSKTDLHQADLHEANLRETNLIGADLSEANLNEANLEEALSLKDTNLRGVIGLTKERLATCQAKGAIIDEDSTVSSP